MERKSNLDVKRGDVWLVDLGEDIGSIQGGIRPVIITQNEMGNKFSTTLQCVALTTELKKINMPTHLILEANQGGLPEKSMTICEQIRPINKSQLIKKYGTLNMYMMRKIDIACNISLGTNTIEKIDYSYIQKRISQIDRLREVLKFTINDDIIEVIKEQIAEIKNYCDKFGVDSSIYTSRYETRGAVNRKVV